MFIEQWADLWIFLTMLTVALQMAASVPSLLQSRLKYLCNYCLSSARPVNHVSSIYFHHHLLWMSPLVDPDLPEVFSYWRVCVVPVSAPCYLQQQNDLGAALITAESLSIFHLWAETHLLTSSPISPLNYSSLLYLLLRPVSHMIIQWS